MKKLMMAALAACAAAGAAANTNEVKRSTLDIKVDNVYADGTKFTRIYVYPTPPKDGSGWKLQCRTAVGEWTDIEAMWERPSFFRCIKVTNGYAFDPETTTVEDYRETFATLSKADYERWQRVKAWAIKYDDYEREHGTSPNALLYTIGKIIDEARASEREN